MRYIKTIFPGNKDVQDINCGECQTSCQSACKTSCTVANQSCESMARKDSLLVLSGGGPASENAAFVRE